MADLLKAGGQDVLQEAAEELDRVEGHLPPAVRADSTIGERDLAVVAGDDPMVADGDAEDVRGEILQRSPAVAGGLRVDHPVATPHRGIGQVQQALAPQDVAELGAKEDRQGLAPARRNRPATAAIAAVGIRPPPGTT